MPPGLNLGLMLQLLERCASSMAFGTGGTRTGSTAADGGDRTPLLLQLAFQMVGGLFVVDHSLNAVALENTGGSVAGNPMLCARTTLTAPGAQMLVMSSISTSAPASGKTVLDVTLQPFQSSVNSALPDRSRYRPIYHITSPKIRFLS